MSKVFVSEAVWRVVDRCVQVLGGQGVTGETLVARIFNEVRGVPHLRWSVGGASLEPGAAHRPERSELVRAVTAQR